MNFIFTIIFNLLLLLLFIKGYFSLNCFTQTNDVIPLNPGINNVSPSGVYIPSLCSEVINVNNMGGYVDQGWDRTNCPHLRNGLTLFESLYTNLISGSDVTINSGNNILLTSCSVSSSAVLGRILIKNGSSLIFDDSNITLNVREIHVEVGGSLLIGSETCRLYSNININFYGSKADSSTVLFDNLNSKGIESLGTVEMHGKKYHPTWTRLSRRLYSGSNLIFLQDLVNWEVGQTILITTSAWYDCPDSLKQTYCGNQAHQNEIKTIVAISSTSNGEQVLQLDSPLQYDHFSSKEYQTEVALLSRRINLNGIDSGDQFGGHLLVAGSSGIGKFSGVRADKFGQLNVLARYPFHFHHLGNNGINSYFQDCSVTSSFFRCFVVHASNLTRLSRNVAYNAIGNCYYLEDGIEENNIFEYNLASFIIPIGPIANGGWSGGPAVPNSTSLINPADTAAAGFYILNSWNDFIGNTASGGWTGFAFPNAPLPIFSSEGSNLGNNNPQNRPTKNFIGNTAHSSGFYWTENGACMYTGATVYVSGSNLYYNSGRFSRSTVLSDGTLAWMQLFDTKTFLCLKGLTFWGNRVEVERYENMDSATSAFLMGDIGINDALVVGTTLNTAFTASNKIGFQYYDTNVHTILSKITFRNFIGSNDYVIQMMDGSDQYLPQGISASVGLTFQNISNNPHILRLQNCGKDCGTSTTSMSSKLQTIQDFDGSLVQLPGTPSILAGDSSWWNIDSSCNFLSNWRMWRCNWNSKRQVAFVEIYVPGLFDGCDTKVGTCPNGNAGYSVGYVNQFGKSTTYGMTVGPWPGVTGFSNMGWYFRVKVATTLLSISGAPSYFKTKNMQLARNNYILLAIAYPKNAVFSVNITRYGTVYKPLPTPLTWAQMISNEVLNDPSTFVCPAGWNSYCSNTGGTGPGWYRDNSYLYLKLVNIGCYNKAGKDQCNMAYPTPGTSTVPAGFKNTVGRFTFHDASLNLASDEFSYEVTVTSCSGCSIVKTYSNIKYYSVSDTIPKSYTYDQGSLVSATLPIPTTTSKSW